MPATVHAVTDSFISQRLKQLKNKEKDVVEKCYKKINESEVPTFTLKL